MALCLLQMRWLQEMIRAIAAEIRDHVFAQLGVPVSEWAARVAANGRDGNESKESRDGKSEKGKERKDVVSKPLSVMVDGSTDSANKEQEIVYMRGVVDGKSSTHFAGNREVRDGTAATVKATLDGMFADFHINLDRLVALGTDGASSMTGEHTGLGVRMKEGLPFLMQIHCICHR
jgi:hypothetical protein